MRNPEIISTKCRCRLDNGRYICYITGVARETKETKMSTTLAALALLVVTSVVVVAVVITPAAIAYYTVEFCRWMDREV